ncbi:hypothetical protein BJ508DRAFT_138669 [Ascobolus immersus RN42]|uniref:Uncharacterized protein n=1 Tax=Ascobolus immersus RN42 TaxID=1160509 RepID=A0A3N4I6A7_ASCIM|nr:hypothetical protein BJ508DRAFT_138669 [Ascobolus immersus RN42]
MDVDVFTFHACHMRLVVSFLTGGETSTTHMYGYESREVRSRSHEMRHGQHRKCVLFTLVALDGSWDWWFVCQCPCNLSGGTHHGMPSHHSTSMFLSALRDWENCRLACQVSERKADSAPHQFLHPGFFESDVDRPLMLLEGSEREGESEETRGCSEDLTESGCSRPCDTRSRP